MYQVIQATYRNGQLILQDKLLQLLEGQTVQVIVFNPRDVIELKKERFRKFIARQKLVLPENYRFNRAELYKR